MDATSAVNPVVRAEMVTIPAVSCWEWTPISAGGILGLSSRTRRFD